MFFVLFDSCDGIFLVSLIRQNGIIYLSTHRKEFIRQNLSHLKLEKYFVNVDARFYWKRCYSYPIGLVRFFYAKSTFVRINIVRFPWGSI